MKTNPVLETTDYSMFKKLSGNRLKNKLHIQKLVDSFEAHPALMQARPVIVNDKYEVIDGQHSLEAAEAAKIPVFYIVIPGISLEETRLLNSTQRRWSLKDYAISWQSERPDIRIALELHEQFGVALSKIGLLARKGTAGTGGGSSVSKMQDGTFKIEDLPRLINLLQMLEDFSGNTEKWNKDSFVIAFNKMVKSDGYDHQRMMTHLGKTQLQHRSSYSDFLRDLEIIYNRGNGSYVKFV